MVGSKQITQMLMLHVGNTALTCIQSHRYPDEPRHSEIVIQAKQAVRMIMDSWCMLSNFARWQFEPQNVCRMGECHAFAEQSKPNLLDESKK